MPIRARSTLLLDLDGTLVDPAPGILGCYRHALASFGIFPPDAEDLRWVIGPSIREGLRQLLDGRGDTEDAVRRYRERYSDLLGSPPVAPLGVRHLRGPGALRHATVETLQD